MRVPQVNLTTSQIKWQKQNQQIVCCNLPLSYDTVSFGAMKKRDFEGIDYAVVEKFKAPIQKFHTNDDLQNWASQRVDELIGENYHGRHYDTPIQRRIHIMEWGNYIKHENDAYTPAIQLIIIDAITKDLKPNDDKLPPILNKGVLADVIDCLNKELKNNPKQAFDFNEMYNSKLKAYYLEDTKIDDTSSKWIIIPSLKNDSDNFETNIEKLKALSHKNWCTKTFNARPYLRDGDFHIYIENGKPKLGIRFIGNTIHEIQGEKNDYMIPVKYYDEIVKYIKQNNFKVSENTKEDLREASKIKKDITKIKTDLEQAIKEKNAFKILEYFAFNPEFNDDGLISISEYKQPCKYVSLGEIGINETELLKNIVEIRGCGDFTNSKATALPELKNVHGSLKLRHSYITKAPKLEYVDGSLNIHDSIIKSLPELKAVGRDFLLMDSQITELPKLKSVGGRMSFRDSKIREIPLLESIGDEIICNSDSNLESLPKLKTIGSNADLSGTNITSFPSLESISGTADFSDAKTKNLPLLKIIKGNAYFANSEIEELPSLEYIGESADFEDSKVRHIPKLKYVEENIFIKYSPLKTENFKNVDYGGCIYTDYGYNGDL